MGTLISFGICAGSQSEHVDSATWRPTERNIHFSGSRWKRRLAMGCVKSKGEPDSPSNVPPISQVFKLSESQEVKTTPKVSSDKKFPATISCKYKIRRLLGKGPHGRVYMVENKLTRIPYAMKVSDGPHGRELLDAEMAVLRRVSHPHVVHLVAYFEAGCLTYLVMELATGGDLFDRIVEKQAFEDREAARVITMVLDAVSYLHQVGVTHRDLKPDNILYYHPGADSKVLLTDFKLANVRRSAEDVTMRGLCGTLEYMAPEVISGMPYTCAVDLWAVGVVTFITLSGTFPFDDENHVRLFERIRRAEYDFSGEMWERATDEAKDFVSKLLVVDPQRRMNAQKALRHRWVRQKISTSKGPSPCASAMSGSSSSTSSDSSGSCNSGSGSSDRSVK